MWRIKDPEFKKATLDFSSSGQKPFEATQILVDGIVFANAVECTDWDEEMMQTIVCDYCGTSGCNSGSRLTLRTSGFSVLFIPAFSEMETDAWSKDEYAPPYYVNRIGTPFCDFDTYSLLRSRIDSLPALSDIKTLKMSEAMRLAQFNMPRKIFGEPPQVELNLNVAAQVFAASPGEPAAHLSKIEELLKRDYENGTPAILRRISMEEDEVSLFIDPQEIITWQPLVRSSLDKTADYELTLEDVFVIEAA